MAVIPSILASTLKMERCNWSSPQNCGLVLSELTDANDSRVHVPVSLVQSVEVLLSKNAHTEPAYVVSLGPALSFCML